MDPDRERETLLIGEHHFPRLGGAIGAEVDDRDAFPPRAGGGGAGPKTIFQGPQDPRRLPVQLVNPASGQLIWLVDAAAAGMAAE